MGREQIALAHQAEHPLAGNPDVATDPKPSPDLAVALALPGRCLQVGFDRQRLVRDRGLRSPTLCRRLLGVLAGGHGVERGAGHAPGGADPPQAVGQTRAGRGGGTHRRDLRRPKGPTRSHGQLSERVPPAPDLRRSRRTLALRSCTGSSRKSRRTTSRLRATCRLPAKPGLRGRAKLARIDRNRPVKSSQFEIDSMFATFSEIDMSFKKELNQAYSIPTDAEIWNPKGKNPSRSWVLVPISQQKHWMSLAMEAAKYMNEHGA